MSNHPEGRSFRERWPDDAAAADWLSAPFVPIAVGGLVGVLGIPVFAAALLTAQPLIAVALLAVAAGAVPLARRPGRPASAARAAGRAAAFLLLVAAGGYLVGAVSSALLDGLCPADGCESRMDGGPAVVAALVLLGSAAVGVAATFATARLSERFARPPIVIDPVVEAWRARRTEVHRDDTAGRS